MTTRLFTSAVFAGLIAGLIAVLLQFALMQSLILEGEEYETGNKSHFGGVLVLNEALEASGEAATEVEEEPENLLKRYSLAFFAQFIVFVGWGLIMVAGFAVADRFGRKVTVKDGLLWGIAGFAAVHMAPAIGLAPELPGTPAAELELRQLWWVTTVIATAMALALFAYGRSALFVGIGLILLVAPHLIGAPRLDGYAGLAPPELSGEYVARSLAVSMAIWAVLGLAAGYFWNRNADT
ncbi:MAG: CbtA family protein [Marinosulfonomonas sp.]|nr:CbtA family protein [Marinosulfonomonas sp.]